MRSRNAVKTRGGGGSRQSRRCAIPINCIIKQSDQKRNLVSNIERQYYLPLKFQKDRKDYYSRSIYSVVDEETKIRIDGETHKSSRDFSQHVPPTHVLHYARSPCLYLTEERNVCVLVACLTFLCAHQSLLEDRGSNRFVWTDEALRVFLALLLFYQLFLVRGMLSADGRHVQE